MDDSVEERARRLLGSPEALLRRYGAIAAKRLYKRIPDLLLSAAKSADADIHRFATEAIEDARAAEDGEFKPAAR